MDPGSRFYFYNVLNSEVRTVILAFCSVLPFSDLSRYEYKHKDAFLFSLAEPESTS